MRKVRGSLVALQFTAMPVAPLGGMVTVGGPSLTVVSFAHWVATPVAASFKLKPSKATEL